MLLNGITLLVIALALTGLVVFVVRTEKIPGWPAVRRKDSPTIYWIAVGVWIFIAAGFLFGSMAELIGITALNSN
jgi:uncharacterized iron-regulated membrane protein